MCYLWFVALGNELSDTSRDDQCGFDQPQEKSAVVAVGFLNCWKEEHWHLKNSHTVKGDSRRILEKQASPRKAMNYGENNTSSKLGLASLDKMAPDVCFLPIWVGLGNKQTESVNCGLYFSSKFLLNQEYKGMDFVSSKSSPRYTTHD